VKSTASGGRVVLGDLQKTVLRFSAKGKVIHGFRFFVLLYHSTIDSGIQQKTAL